MKSAVALAVALLSTFAAASHGIVHHHRSQCITGGHKQGSALPGEPNANGWGQKAKGTASFTVYKNCTLASCGLRITSGFTAAVNERAFGNSQSFGDACGRCFKIAPTLDPYTPSYQIPEAKRVGIVVKVNDLCPISNNKQWCSQTASTPHNQFGRPMHFDLCQDSGASDAFFSDGRGAMLGNYEEVSCGHWIDNQKCSVSLWDNWCMANTNTPLWSGKGCGNNVNGPPN